MGLNTISVMGGFTFGFYPVEGIWPIHDKARSYQRPGRKCG